MTAKFIIESDTSLPPPAKRGRPKEREVAHKAANAIRSGQFNRIEDAAASFFDEHLQRRRITNASDPDARKDRFKAFIGFIADDLKANPKSFSTFAVLGKRRKKQVEQPAVKARRAKKILELFQDALDSSDG